MNPFPVPQDTCITSMTNSPRASQDERAYQAYVNFCATLGVNPASWEVWGETTRFIPTQAFRELCPVVVTGVGVSGGRCNGQRGSQRFMYGADPD